MAGNIHLTGRKHARDSLDEPWQTNHLNSNVAAINDMHVLNTTDNYTPPSPAIQIDMQRVCGGLKRIRMTSPPETISDTLEQDQLETLHSENISTTTTRVNLPTRLWISTRASQDEFTDSIHPEELATMENYASMNMQLNQLRQTRLLSRGSDSMHAAYSQESPAQLIQHSIQIDGQQNLATPDYYRSINEQLQHYHLLRTCQH